MNTKLVKEYYQSSQWLYRLLLYNENSLGMHHGFWERGIKNRHQAMLAENQAIIDIGNITKEDRVLDAGCGVGGTAIYIARQTGAQVTGITIDPKQVILAKKYAKLHHVENRTSFQTQDYTRTNFPDDHFDVVYGIESICHAKPKSVFLKEAWRILKPGGKLIVLDFYASRPPTNSSEETIIHTICRGFTFEEFITVDVMSVNVQEAGYVNLKSWSKIKQAAPTIIYLSRLATLASPLLWVSKLLPFSYMKAAYANALAIRKLEKAYRLGLADYAIHIARKPRTA